MSSVWVCASRGAGGRLTLITQRGNLRKIYSYARNWPWSVTLSPLPLPTTAGAHLQATSRCHMLKLSPKSFTYQHALSVCVCWFLKNQFAKATTKTKKNNKLTYTYAYVKHTNTCEYVCESRFTQQVSYTCSNALWCLYLFYSVSGKKRELP